MNKKIAIALIALVGIGLYALPQTMALFAGQHSFYNIDPTGNQIPCAKCHGDVKAELDSNVNTETGTKAPHADMKCEFCHRLQIGQASGDSAFVLLSYTGKAINISTGNQTSVSRLGVFKVSDYEAQLIPNNITYDAAVELSTGRVIEKPPRSGLPVPGRIYMDKNATAGGKLSPLYDTANLNYSATVWAYGTVDSDVINQTSGIGTVKKIVSAKVYPTYEDVLANATTGTFLSKKDTLFTATEAFNPAMVNFANGTSPTDTKMTVLLDGAGSRTVNAGSRYHAASLVACMDCHAGASPQPGHETARLGMTNPDDETFCYRCHYGTEEPAVLINGTNYSHLRTYELDAGGFGSGVTNNGADTGEAEVHKQFTLNAPDIPQVGMFGGRFTPANNAACIACHTHVDAEITYQRPTTIQFTANAGTDGNWTVNGYGASVNPSIVNQGDNPADPIVGTGGSSTG